MPTKKMKIMVMRTRPNLRKESESPCHNKTDIKLKRNETVKGGEKQMKVISVNDNHSF